MKSEHDVAGKTHPLFRYPNGRWFLLKNVSKTELFPDASSIFGHRLFRDLKFLLETASKAAHALLQEIAGNNPELECRAGKNDLLLNAGNRLTWGWNCSFDLDDYG